MGSGRGARGRIAGPGSNGSVRRPLRSYGGRGEELHGRLVLARMGRGEHRCASALAVEVETGKSDATSNIEKALSAGLSVLSVATSSDVDNKIKEQLSRRPQLDNDRIRIVNAQSCNWQ